ncbi:hypothetical protein [Bacillus sp. 1NLA3E]|uniref:hypothetical protein n=1 Tax=Bacillus sp. 1NLA3E TaxID=666686 RepID=UPI0003049960|nr:hypothetical protein [Bacillus sp. 1NLA3E]
MEYKEENFLQGQASFLIIIDVICTFVFSMLPEWSIKVVFFNLSVSIFSIALAGYWCKRISSHIRYNSLVNFLIFISMGFFTVTPMLRMTINTQIFWFFLLLYLFVFVYSMIERELIFQSLVMKAGKSKLSKGMIVFFIIIMLVGSLTARNGQEMVILKLLNDYQGLFFGSCLIYVVGLFFTFLSVIMLKKPEEIEK